MIRSPIRTNKGYFYNYGIDEYGTIYNLKKNKVLKWKINENGYANICLRKDSKCYYFKIHRLVLMNFAPIVIFKNDCNHIDGNKLNNHISNLEWCTRSRNIKHAWEFGLRKANPKYGLENPTGKFTDDMVVEILYDYYINNNSIYNIAKKFNCSESYVKALKSNRLRKVIVKNFKKYYKIKE